MLQAFFHNDSNDKPHIHVWDTEGELDVCPPMYSKQEVREWVRKTETLIFSGAQWWGCQKIKLNKC